MQNKTIRKTNKFSCYITHSCNKPHQHLFYSCICIYNLLYKLCNKIYKLLFTVVKIILTFLTFCFIIANVLCGTSADTQHMFPVLITIFLPVCLDVYAIYNEFIIMVLLQFLNSGFVHCN